MLPRRAREAPAHEAHEAADGLARAGWFQQAVRSAARVLATDPALLEPCAQLADLVAPPLVLPPFTTPADLRAQHLGTPLMALAEDRPSPAVQERFHWSDGQQPTAAVVISLFNYADRISAALPGRQGDQDADVVGRATAVG